MLNKCYLLKEKIPGLCLGCPHHNKENKGIIFLSLQNNGNRPYGADNQDIAPEFFPLRDNIFLANVKSSFFPEIEIKFRVFCNRPILQDFVPYWDRCPAPPMTRARQWNLERTSKLPKIVAARYLKKIFLCIRSMGNFIGS